MLKISIFPILSQLRNWTAHRKIEWKNIGIKQTVISEYEYQGTRSN